MGGGPPVLGHGDKERPAPLLHARNEAPERGGLQQAGDAFRHLSRRQVHIRTVRAPHGDPGESGLAREERGHSAGVGPFGRAGEFVERRRPGLGV